MELLISECELWTIYSRIAQEVAHSPRRALLPQKRDQRARKKFPCSWKGNKSLAHITGRGFVDIFLGAAKKLRRHHPQIDLDMPPIFQLIQAQGGVPGSGIVSSFQHGPSHDADQTPKGAEVLKFIRMREKAW